MASNPGQALWSGIIDGPQAEAVADRLMDPSLFSGWGVRTLASDQRAYNPIDYQAAPSGRTTMP